MPKQTLIPGKKKGNFPNLKGAPITYDSVLLSSILDAVFDHKGSLTQVAWRVGVHRNTFQDWMKYGEADQQKGLDTDLAQLSVGVRQRQGDVLIWLFDEALNDPKKAKFLQFWITNVFRADFGQDANLVQLLVEKTAQLEQSLKLLDGVGQVVQGDKSNDGERQETDQA